MSLIVPNATRETNLKRFHCMFFQCQVHLLVCGIFFSNLQGSAR